MNRLQKLAGILTENTVNESHGLKVAHADEFSIEYNENEDQFYMYQGNTIRMTIPFDALKKMVEKLSEPTSVFYMYNPQ